MSCVVLYFIYFIFLNILYIYIYYIFYIFIYLYILYILCIILYASGTRAGDQVTKAQMMGLSKWADSKYVANQMTLAEIPHIPHATTKQSLGGVARADTTASNVSDTPLQGHGPTVAPGNHSPKGSQQ